MTNDFSHVLVSKTFPGSTSSLEQFFGKGTLSAEMRSAAEVIQETDRLGSAKVSRESRRYEAVAPVRPCKAARTRSRLSELIIGVECKALATSLTVQILVFSVKRRTKSFAIVRSRLEVERHAARHISSSTGAATALRTSSSELEASRAAAYALKNSSLTFPFASSRSPGFEAAAARLSPAMSFRIEITVLLVLTRMDTITAWSPVLSSAAKSPRKAGLVGLLGARRRIILLSPRLNLVVMSLACGTESREIVMSRSSTSLAIRPMSLINMLYSRRELLRSTDLASDFPFLALMRYINARKAATQMLLCSTSIQCKTSSAPGLYSRYAAAASTEVPSLS
mmetsp:Transcript_14880/g.21912  ORF Transcript_14880/g.21912 Transcript_14880/m.21912 type:complete len:339 (-) Transcript_14880:205-1221(-)